MSNVALLINCMHCEVLPPRPLLPAVHRGDHLHLGAARGAVLPAKGTVVHFNSTSTSFSITQHKRLAQVQLEDVQFHAEGITL